MQHSATVPPPVITDSGIGTVVPNVMTAGTSGGSMMTMPQAPINGNPVLGSIQQPSPDGGDGGVQNGNQIMNNPTEGAQQFCLRWNSYPATVATQLASLRAAEDFVDVTLACDGRQLRAHKLVLSACSPYFMQLFKSTPCKHPVIFLKDVGFRQLVALLEFMYAGEVNVSQAELPALLRTAEALQVRGLADTNPNNNNFPSPPKPGFPELYPSDQTSIPPQNPPQAETSSSEPSGVCSSQNATNPPCDSSSNVMNPCSNNSSTKRSGKNEDEESDESQDFDMVDPKQREAYMNEDGSLSQQFEDTGEVFDQNNIGDTNSFDLSQEGDLGGELLPGDEEGSDVEEDENSLDGGKDFPGFPVDGSYGELDPTQNGIDSPLNAAGPSGNNLGNSGVPGGEPGKDGMLLPPPLPGEGRGRNRLARSLWPPGIPYHGPQQCPYCPRILSNVGNWRKHVLTMHFAHEKRYKCNLCSSAFRTSEYLQKHYVRVHNYPQKMTRKKFVEQT